MHPPPSIFLLAAIGLGAGLLSGLLGIGGAILIIPALIFLAGFPQLLANGTSLAVLLPPIGLGAAIVYYRHGNVDIRAALVIAPCMILAAWAGSLFAHRINPLYLRIGFGVFLVVAGIYTIINGIQKLGK